MPVTVNRTLGRRLAPSNGRSREWRSTSYTWKWWKATCPQPRIFNRTRYALGPKPRLLLLRPRPQKTFTWHTHARPRDGYTPSLGRGPAPSTGEPIPLKNSEWDRDPWTTCPAFKHWATAARVGKVIKPGLKKNGFYYRFFLFFFKWIWKKPGFFWVFSNSSKKSWQKLQNLKKRWVLVTCAKFYKLLCCWSIDCWVPICHSKMFLFNFKLIVDQFKAIFWKNCNMQSGAICKFMQYANSRNMQIYAICKVLHYAKSWIMQSLVLY